ncbi:hypothetical protein [Candidatus Viridilinea mediisalina]|uniref:HRDC domain-containing protein n=1 Tax=Candidatus Viridilinea mediisalina TaxID=2024553 RepID=A0A2A6RNB8_9CHLR|nr:hypothetical protein [Candidatus Viridilinea mediisalina]PDW04378.1 hypothetical protein CJ255_03690 [Candidatus Viridilinea mediisalina]
MRCRHFTLRRHPRYAQEDADQLNEFLRQVSVYTVQSSNSEAGCWSVLVFYEEGNDPERPVNMDAGQADSELLSSEEQQTYAQLQTWRKQRAQLKECPADFLVDDSTLNTIARNYMSPALAGKLAREGDSEN